MWVFAAVAVIQEENFFITTLANKGIGVRILASLAGHRSIAVTQRYIEVNDEQKRNAVELI